MTNNKEFNLEGLRVWTEKMNIEKNNINTEKYEFAMKQVKHFVSKLQK